MNLCSCSTTEKREICATTAAEVEGKVERLAADVADSASTSFFLQTLSTGILHPRLCPQLTSFKKQFSPCPMSLWAQLACVHAVQEQEFPREGSFASH